MQHLKPKKMTHPLTLPISDVNRAEEAQDNTVVALPESQPRLGEIQTPAESVTAGTPIENVTDRTGFTVVQSRKQKKLAARALQRANNSKVPSITYKGSKFVKTASTGPRYQMQDLLNKREKMAVETHLKLVSYPLYVTRNKRNGMMDSASEYFNWFGIYFIKKDLYEQYMYSPSLASNAHRWKPWIRIIVMDSVRMCKRLNRQAYLRFQHEKAQRKLKKLDVKAAKLSPHFDFGLDTSYDAVHQVLSEHAKALYDDKDFDELHKTSFPNVDRRRLYDQLCRVHIFNSASIPSNRRHKTLKENTVKYIQGKKEIKGTWNEYDRQWHNFTNYARKTRIEQGIIVSQNETGIALAAEAKAISLGPDRTPGITKMIDLSHNFRKNSKHRSPAYRKRAAARAAIQIKQQHIELPPLAIDRKEELMHVINNAVSEKLDYHTYAHLQEQSNRLVGLNELPSEEVINRHMSRRDRKAFNRRRDAKLVSQGCVPSTDTESSSSISFSREDSPFGMYMRALKRTNLVLYEDDDHFYSYTYNFDTAGKLIKVYDWRKLIYAQSMEEQDNYLDPETYAACIRPTELDPILFAQQMVRRREFLNKKSRRRKGKTLKSRKRRADRRFKEEANQFIEDIELLHRHSPLPNRQLSYARLHSTREPSTFRVYSHQVAPERSELTVDFSRDASLIYDVRPSNPLPFSNRQLYKPDPSSVTEEIENARRQVEAFNWLDHEPQLDGHGLLDNTIDSITNLGSACTSALNLLNKLKYKPNTKGYSDMLMARCEDLVMFVSGISSCTNPINLAALFHLYIRSFCPDSLTLKAKEIVSEWFEATFPCGLKEQADDGSHPAFENFLSMFKAGIKNWKEVRTCALASSISNAASIFMTFAFMNDPTAKDSEVFVDKSRFRFLNGKVWNIQKNCTDFYVMCAETLYFFLERGFAVFRTGDWKNLLYLNEEAAALDNEYALLLSGIPLLESGNIHLIEKDEIKGIQDVHDYEYRVDKFIGTISLLNRAETVPQQKAIYANRLVQMRKVKTDLIIHLQAQGMREAAYSVLIFGCSSIGKSSISDYVSKTILAFNNFASEKQNICYLSDVDKFESEVTGAHTCYILDDMANTKPEYTSRERPPTQKIIDFVNNVPKTALKAEAHLKGTVAMRPRLVIATTNVKHLMAAQYSNEPASILRRFRTVLTIKLKSTHTNHSGAIDATAARNDPSAWLVTAERVIIERSEVEHIRDGIKYEVIVHDGVPLRDVDLWRVLNFLKEDSRAHYTDQNELVRNSDNLFSTNLCTEHSLPPRLCPFCKVDNFDFMKQPIFKAETTAVIPDNKLSFTDRIFGMFGSSDDATVVTDVATDQDTRSLSASIRTTISTIDVPPVGTVCPPTEVSGLIDDDATIATEDNLRFSSGQSMTSTQQIEESAASNTHARRQIFNHICRSGRIPVIPEGSVLGLEPKLEAHSRIELLKKKKRRLEAQAGADLTILDKLDVCSIPDLDKVIPKESGFGTGDNPNGWFNSKDSGEVFANKDLEDKYAKVPLSEIAITTDNTGNPVSPLGRLLDDFKQARKVTNTKCPNKTIVQGLRERWDKSSLITKMGLSSATVAAAIYLYTCGRNANSMHVLGEEGALPEGHTPKPLIGEKESVWAPAKLCDMPSSDAGKTTSIDDLAKYCRKRMACFTSYQLLSAFPDDKLDDDGQVPASVINSCVIIGGEKRYPIKCSAFPIEGTVWCVPKHMIEPLLKVSTFIPVKVTRHLSDDRIGTNINTTISKRDVEYIPDSELCMINLMGDISESCLHHLRRTSDPYKKNFDGYLVFKDKPHFPETYGSPVKIDSTQKDVRFKLSDGELYAKNAIWYQFPGKTAPGLCMSVLLNDCSSRHIAGFHVAGYTGHSTGVACTLSAEQARTAITNLASRRLVAHGASFLDASIYGINIEYIDEVHPRHAMNHLTDGANYRYMGAIKDYPDRNFRSEVKKSLISSSVEEILGLPVEHGPPNSSCLGKHWQRDLETMSHTNDIVDVEVLDRAFDDLYDLIASKMTPEILAEIKPLSLDVAVAGADGVPGIDRVNLSSSCGFPINKPKREYIKESDRLVPGISAPLDIDPIILQRINEIDLKLKTKKAIYTLYQSCLKDEPTKLTKDKIRIFSCCDVATTILVRKYYLPIIRALHYLNYDVESAVGCNAFGADWDRIAQKFKSLHPDALELLRFIAGDYGKFDKGMSIQFTSRGVFLFVKIAMLAGYSDEDIQRMCGLGSDMVMPVYIIRGILIQIFGSTPSGIPITVDINNFSNSLCERYVFYSLHKGTSKFNEPFHKYVCAINYGDDNIMFVHPDEDKFSHTAMRDVLATIGLTYTMADKNSESVPYVSFSELEFLKRKFRFEEELNRYVAPIDEKSISKMLHCHLVKKGSDITMRERSAQAMQTACVEWFLHGREIFELRREQLLAVAHKNGLDNIVKLPTWEYCLEHVGTDLLPTCYNPLSDDESSEQYTQLLDSHFNKWNWDEVESVFSHWAGDPINTLLLNNDKECTWSMETKSTSALEANAPILLEAHSSYAEGNTTDSVQIVDFQDYEPGHLAYNSGEHDATRDTALDARTDMADFFRRPIRIAHYEYTPSDMSLSKIDFQPWTLWLGNARVSNRINNFRLAHFKLHLRFLVNGSTFHYGSFMASYLPLTMSTSGPFSAPVTRNNWIDAIAESQRMHLHFNPSNNQGGEMILPFLYHKDYLDLTETDFVNLGVVTIRQLTRLEHANGDISPVSICVYAWAEDMKLAAPTKFDAPFLSAQGDEYGDGIVSKPASAIAKAAGMLSKAPVIGKYATATQIGASLIASTAKHFGFGNPPLLEPDMPMRPSVIGQLAVSNVDDTVTKLTVDAKQEVSIDGNIVGDCSHDQLDIKSIAAIESYYDTFLWSTADSAEARLYTAIVHPGYTRILGPYGDTTTEHHLTPMATLDAAFHYWRGRMRFRFQIASTPLFRGKLKVVYDPVGVFVGNEQNVQFTKIIDLASQQDFTLDVGWASPRSYLRCSATHQGNRSAAADLSLIDPTNFDHNGVLQFYVLTKLSTTADIASAIGINVFVSMQDAEFAVPRHAEINKFSIYPQLFTADRSSNLDAQGATAAEGIEGAISAPDSEDRAPIQHDIIYNFNNMSNDSKSNLVYFGETVSNLRSLFKRYGFYRSFILARGQRSIIKDWTFGGYRGYETSQPWDKDSLDQPYNYRTTHFIQWFTPCYATRRGALRLKFVPVGSFAAWGVLGSDMPTVTRLDEDTSIPSVNTTLADPATNAIKNYSMAFDYTMMDGAAGEYTVVNPVLNVEIPYYSPWRFISARITNGWSILSGDHWYDTKYKYMFSNRSTNTGTLEYVEIYQSAGEDFTLQHWIGCPILYVYPNPNPAGLS